MYSITNPTKNNHKIPIKTISTLNRVDRFFNPLFSEVCGVSRGANGVGVVVVVGVGVETGKMSVISGSGIKVVVAVFDAVNTGVDDCDGAFVALVGV
jgi:hypothetical protein